MVVDYLCGSSVIPRVLLRGRQKGRGPDGEGHVMKEAEGKEVMRYRAVSQGMRKSSRSWTKQNGFSPRASGKTAQ